MWGGWRPEQHCLHSLVLASTTVCARFGLFLDHCVGRCGLVGGGSRCVSVERFWRSLRPSQVGLHTTPLFRGRQGRATDKTPY